MKKLIALLLVALLALGTLAWAEEAAPVETAEEQAAAETAETEPTDEAEAPAEGEGEAEAAPVEAAAEAVIEMIRNGSAGDAVRALQQKLNDLGFDCGKVDGIFGARTEAALKGLQAALGWEETGEILPDQLEEIQAIALGDGVNLVKDGRFADIEANWEPWGHPTLCEGIEAQDKTWMHLVSTGEKFEGLHQNAAARGNADNAIELEAGQTYVLSLVAYAADGSVGKQFKCGIHNNAADGSIQEQYWTPEFTLGAESKKYSTTFTSTVDGTMNIMIGTGVATPIDACFSDILVERGSIASEWTAETEAESEEGPAEAEAENEEAPAEAEPETEEIPTEAEAEGESAEG